jgi:3-phenylpropionate/trans-cinnamate dioxygenase ferredoxin reductase subunit
VTVAASAARRVIVVGAGHGGGTFVALLRQSGFGGEVVLIGDEPDLPYQRPPLSKAFTGGTIEQALRDPDFYSEQDISTRLGESVVSIDRQERTILTSAGHTVAYDYLVLAPGAEARRLDVPGADLPGVQVLRSLDDARALRDGVTAGGPIAIVGGGYVGLEVAAVARAHGSSVTVIEREDRILARVASPTFSRIIEEHHAARGVTVLTGSQVTGFLGDDSGVRAVALSDGSEVACSLALVGVGAIARDQLGRSAGLTCEDGIVVDHCARTNDPAILAIGDVASRPLHGGGSMRLESIPSATEQAKQAVATIVGVEPHSIEVPWFWSDQFDLKIKIVGMLREPYTTVVRGDPSSGKFALIHHHIDKVVAVEAANRPGDFMAGKRMLADGHRFDPMLLADPDVELRTLVPG